MAGVIHVGAWTGEEYLDHPGPLLLFEPQQEPFAKLRASFQDHPNCEIFNVALGSEEAQMVMHTAHPNHSSSLLEPLYPGTGPITFGGTELVKMTTLDSVMTDRDPLYEVLVLDTQGYELEVLKGARSTLSSINRVEVEMHDPEHYLGAALLDDVDAFLLSLDTGFTRTSWNQESSDDLGDAVYERIGH